MIQVTTTKQANGYTQIVVNGHANYASKGQDLVCAGVSAIVIGTCNALYELIPDYDGVVMEENQICITVHQPTERSNLILETMLIQLQTVQQKYAKYIVMK